MNRIDRPQENQNWIKGMINLPTKSMQSTQYNLFSAFYGEGQLQEQYSNTIELWDAIPKYAGKDAAVTHNKKNKKPLAFYKQHFIWYKMPKADNHPQECELKLTPAKIETDDGYEEIFPGTTEEMVEEILKKIFIDQRYGIHDPQQHKSYVKFTTRMIRKRLKDAGRTRSHRQIVDALLCMNTCNIDVRMKGRRGKALYSAPILPVLTAIDRQDWLENPDAMWMAQLSPLITEAINNLEYKQYNQETQIELDTPLARWLHLKLNHEFTNADLSTSYEIPYTSMKRDSGYLQNVRTSANLKTCRKAIKELENKNILASCEEEIIRNGNKIIEVVFKLYPHYPFMKHMKASNRRHIDNQQKLFQEGFSGPWRDKLERKLALQKSETDNEKRRQASIRKATNRLDAIDDAFEAGIIED